MSLGYILFVLILGVFNFFIFYLLGRYTGKRRA